MKSRLKTLFAVVLVAVASVSSFFFLVKYFSQQETLQTKREAVFFARTIDNALQRLEHLPYVLAQTQPVTDALEQGNGQDLNPVLKRIAGRAKADHIFLMDLNGKTIAASNYESPDSFVGNHYTFRPYFRDAISGEPGHFYAIGATTGEPGYFVSVPVRDRFGNIFGVMVVKTGLQSLARAWRQSGAHILVSNIDSVIVLASDPSNQFQTLRPLSAHARLTLENAQQFANQQLLPLDWRVGDNGQVRLDGKEYLLTQVDIEQEDWTLNMLTSLSDIRQRAALVLAGALLLVFGVIIASTSFRSARLEKALAQSDRDRARLTQEIEVRRAAESDLKTARDELEHSSRLAALGQLSASITHELGQPISAMRNYLAAEEIGTEAAPNSLNPVLSRLLDRMQNINSQLRVFASPGIGETARFDLRRASDAAIELVAHALEAADIKLTRRYAGGPVDVEANQQQVEQVLVNLLRNAVDAVEGQDRREIAVAVDTEGDRAFARVTDSGVGLEGRTIADLQEPFMTTKASGQGMGLGLAISAQIARNSNGRLDARDAKQGGAEFTLGLPLSEDQS